MGRCAALTHAPNVAGKTRTKGARTFRTKVRVRARLQLRTFGSTQPEPPKAAKQLQFCYAKFTLVLSSVIFLFYPQCKKE
jgi:hypothetical protein